MRILEQIDSKGVSRFYPQFWCLVWCKYKYRTYDYICFDTLEEAMAWKPYKHNAIEIVHENPRT